MGWVGVPFYTVVGWRYSAQFHCIGVWLLYMMVPLYRDCGYCTWFHCIGVRGKKLQNDDRPHCVCTQIFVFSDLMTMMVTMTTRMMMIDHDHEDDEEPLGFSISHFSLMMMLMKSTLTFSTNFIFFSLQSWILHPWPSTKMTWRFHDKTSSFWHIQMSLSKSQHFAMPCN